MSEIQRRHDEVYATRGLPSFNYDQVEERVWAGRNPLTARDIDVLMNQGITHILDLREPHEWSAPHFGRDAIEEIAHRGLSRLGLPVLDMGAPRVKEIKAACAFLDQTLRDEKSRVYVHCRAGMERTAAILIAWLARREKLSYDEAFGVLRQRRAIFQPLPNQEKAVRNWLKTQQARDVSAN